MAGTMIGIIGGSGLYEIAGLEDPEWRSVESPWGAPSDAILTGVLDGVPMAFLPRHGRGHVHSPTTVPYRANIDALKRLGVTDVISVSACGSFREEMAPGDFVIVDQFIDRTSGARSRFLAPAASPMFRSPTQPARGLGPPASRPPARRGSPCMMAAHILLWRDRNSPASRNRRCTANTGGVT